MLLGGRGGEVHVAVLEWIAHCIVHVPDVKIGGIITNLLNKFGYDFRLAWYLRCPEMVDGPSDHFAKCHFGSHLLIWPPVFSSNIGG